MAMRAGGGFVSFVLALLLVLGRSYVLGCCMGLVFVLVRGAMGKGWGDLVGRVEKKKPLPVVIGLRGWFDWVTGYQGILGYIK